MTTTTFAASTTPVAPTRLQTDSEGMTARDIRIETTNGSMPAYEAKPLASGDYPVVIVIQEIFGVHEHIRDVVRRFAKLGYYAIAPELYFRQGDPRQYADIDTLFGELVNKVPDEQVLGDLSATLDWAIEHGGDASRVAATGFCWGGRITWLFAAHEPRLKAAVAWYGKLEGQSSPMQPRHPIELASKLNCPVLGLYGEADTSIPLESVERFRASLATPSQVVTYRDAPHAFFADYRPSYREEAAKDGWRRLLMWLVENGVAPGAQ